LTLYGFSDQECEDVIHALRDSGGRYLPHFCAFTTHFIINTADNTSAEYQASLVLQAANMAWSLTPHWINDCMATGHHLPEAPYAWPNPICLQDLEDQFAAMIVADQHARAQGRIRQLFEYGSSS